MDTRHPLQTEVISHVLLCTYLESKCTPGSYTYLKKKKKRMEEKKGICMLLRPQSLGGMLARQPGASDFPGHHDGRAAQHKHLSVFSVCLAVSAFLPSIQRGQELRHCSQMQVPCLGALVSFRVRAAFGRIFSLEATCERQVSR